MWMKDKFATFFEAESIAVALMSDDELDKRVKELEEIWEDLIQRVKALSDEIEERKANRWKLLNFN